MPLKHIQVLGLNRLNNVRLYNYCSYSLTARMEPIDSISTQNGGYDSD